MQDMDTTGIPKSYFSVPPKCRFHLGFSLDALKGLVYYDDSQVSDLLCRKMDLNGDLRIQNPSTVLLETLRDSQQFLHITVANALTQEVAAW